MTPLDAVILGIVEGITEFLPISSTGHLILASSLLGLDGASFEKTFEIAIQLGAILSVVVLYWRSLLDVELLKKLIVAFIPTGVIGFTLYPLVKSVLLGSEIIVLWSLLVGGIVLVLFERLHSAGPSAAGVSSITYRQALTIGVFQSVAIIPGVSRSAATIIGGLWLGLSRTTVVEFSFLLAVPTMAAATGYDLLKSASQFSTDQFGLLAIGGIVSFVVALLAIRFLLGFVRSYSFAPFGYYRIAVAIAFFAIILM